jgi:hypothetical protein
MAAGDILESVPARVVALFHEHSGDGPETLWSIETARRLISDKRMEDVWSALAKAGIRPEAAPNFFQSACTVEALWASFPDATVSELKSAIERIASLANELAQAIKRNHYAISIAGGELRLQLLIEAAFQDRAPGEPLNDIQAKVISGIRDVSSPDEYGPNSLPDLAEILESFTASLRPHQMKLADFRGITKIRGNTKSGISSGFRNYVLGELRKSLATFDATIDNRHHIAAWEVIINDKDAGLDSSLVTKLRKPKRTKRSDVG